MKISTIETAIQKPYLNAHGINWVRILMEVISRNPSAYSDKDHVVYEAEMFGRNLASENGFYVNRRRKAALNSIVNTLYKQFDQKEITPELIVGLVREVKRRIS